MDNWYIVETSDDDHEAGYRAYRVRCDVSSDVITAIETAKTQHNISAWRLTVTEYEFDPTVEGKKCFVASINAEEFFTDLQYSFYIGSRNVELRTNGKSWDDCEDKIADLCIAWGFAVEREMSGGYNERPKFKFRSFRPVVLPKSKREIHLTFSCKDYTPPDCVVNVTRRRSWSNQASYSTYCNM